MSSSQSTKRKRKAKPSTDKALCDLLARRLVMHRAGVFDLERGGGMCERCGYQPGTDWAHIIRRHYAATRCVEDNGWWLCRQCHYTVDNFVTELVKLVELTIGVDRYEELRQLAQAGRPRGLWWRAERERLTARCEELGISTKFRSSA